MYAYIIEAEHATFNVNIVINKKNGMKRVIKYWKHIICSVYRPASNYSAIRPTVMMPAKLSESKHTLPLVIHNLHIRLLSIVDACVHKSLTFCAHLPGFHNTYLFMRWGLIISKSVYTHSKVLALELSTEYVV